MKYREYKLTTLFDVSYGNKLDKNKMTYGCPSVNFVSRTAKNNGISDVVDRIENIETFKPGDISLALGGSIGSCFIQEQPFYTGQNVAVLSNPDMSKLVKLYMISSIEKYCKKTFVAFSNEINKHLKHLTISLPVKTTQAPDFETLEAILAGGGIDMSNIDTSNWKEFKIGELFDYQLGDIDLQAQHIDNKGFPVITSGEQNRGILGETSKEAKVIKTNSLTVDMFGHVYYRDFDYKLVTHARVFALIPKYHFNKSVGLFLESHLSFLTKMYSYNNMCSFGKIKDLTIKLPVKETEEIDYEFMENYIRDLERERISDLESYLKVTGLDDIELTQEEQDALMKMRGEMNGV